MVLDEGPKTALHSAQRILWLQLGTVNCSRSRGWWYVVGGWLELKEEKTAITRGRISTCLNQLNLPSWCVLDQDQVFDLFGERVHDPGRSTVNRFSQRTALPRNEMLKQVQHDGMWRFRNQLTPSSRTWSGISDPIEGRVHDLGRSTRDVSFFKSMQLGTVNLQLFLILSKDGFKYSQICRKLHSALLGSQYLSLEIVVFSDYVLPNLALASKELDANFFQHFQYLKSFTSQIRITIPWSLAKSVIIYSHRFSGTCLLQTQFFTNQL